MQHLILLHGALGSAAQLENIKSQLQDSFEVHSFNFEGHGGRQSKNDFSIALFVQNTLDYMDENKIHQASFFGYSMGGYVALKFATLYPDRIQKIFTYGTKFDWTPESAAKETKMLVPEKIKEKVPGFASSLEKLHFPLDWEENMRKTASMMLNLGEKPELDEKVLQSITTNTTICVGSKDQMISIEESEKASLLLTNGELHIFENFEHPIEKVNIEVLIRLIKMKLKV